MLRSLGLLLKEVYPFLNAEEKEGSRKTYTDLNRKMNLGEYESEKIYLFNEIDDFDYWLRDQLHDKGLLMAKADDPSMALK
jgi:hypothetical protein